MREKEIKSTIPKQELFYKISNFANKFKDRVFRTAVINGGALQKRLKTVNTSKQNKGIVFQHIDENIEDFYILNGEQILFWENTYKKVDGQSIPATIITDVWTDISFTGIASEGGVKLKNGKKPEKLIRRIIELTTDEGDIVLDYYLGSGTTAAVAHKMNRQYIGIEQMNYIETLVVERLKKIIGGEQGGISKSVNWQGGGSFVYCELAKANQIFIESIQDAKNTEELITIWNEMQDKAFLSYLFNKKSFDKLRANFLELTISEQKKFLIEILDKNMLYVPLSEIDDQTYKITESDKILNKHFFD